MNMRQRLVAGGALLILLMGNVLLARGLFLLLKLMPR